MSSVNGAQEGSTLGLRRQRRPGLPLDQVGAKRFTPAHRRRAATSPMVAMNRAPGPRCQRRQRGRASKPVARVLPLSPNTSSDRAS